VKRNVIIPFVCQGCSTAVRVEYVTEPIRTGAMWTVDCPLCGTSKMIPDEPVRMYHYKDGNWIESAPHCSYSR